MRIQKYSGLVLVSVALAVIVSFVWVNSSLAKDKGKTENIDKLLNALAQNKGKDVSDLEVLKEAIFSLPDIEGKYPTAKVRDKKTGELLEITIDEKGNSVDKEKLSEDNLKNHKAKYGKLEPELYEKLQVLGENDTVKVSIWLDAPDEPLERPTEQDYKSKGEYIVEMEMLTRIKAKKAKLHDVKSPLIAHMKNIGVDDISLDELAPIVYASLNKNHINSLEQRNDVSELFLVKEVKPMLDTSVSAIGGRAVWSWGSTGIGQKVGIVETEGIATANPYLTAYNRINACIGNSRTPYHATKVAGVVGSRSNPYTGVSYNAILYGAESCSTYTDGMNAATSWAHDQGVQILNASWGAVTNGNKDSESQYHDNISRAWGASVIDAAGNCDDIPNCYVVSPALAFDAIAVGGWFDESNSLPLTYWASWKNPISAHSDREKPEIIAPYIVNTTSGISPWISYEMGTSFSTPHVSGVVALLEQTNSTFRYWPSLVKATLMATATGSYDSCSNAPLWGSACDSQDGAGRVAADAAWYIATDSSKWVTATVTPSSFNGNGDLYYSFYGYAGTTVRVAIAWDTSTSYAYYSSRPGVDLDLFVKKPSGGYVLPYGSSSWDNDFELLEFTAPETGYYTVDIYKNRFSIGSTHLSVAWYNHY